MGKHISEHNELEILEIKKRYQRRNIISAEKYHPLNPSMIMINQEKERALLKFFNNFKLNVIKDLKLLEVGCGGGQNLLMFTKYGFSPGNLYGNDLINSRISSAQNVLSSQVTLSEGDATQLDYPKEHFDIVFQSMVFSSILDDNLQNDLAKKMWVMLKSGGYILWYDFIYNNPFNKDVRGVNYTRIKQLFPGNKIIKRRITLAPPLSFYLTRFHSSFYTIFNSFYVLRTHLLCWIKKK